MVQPLTPAQQRDRKITIEQPDASAAANDYGETDLTVSGGWSSYAVRFASVQTKGGREFWKVDKVEAEVSHMLSVLRDSVTALITPRMRVKLGSRILQIVSAVDVDDARAEVQIQCKEVV